MAKGADLVIKIFTDTSNAANGLQRARNDFDKFQGSMQALAVPAGVAVGALSGVAAAGITAASDLQQAFGGVDAVFGESGATIKRWAADAAQSVGLTAAEYASAATRIGGQLNTLGVPMDQVTGKTDEMIRLAADLAATYGGTTQEAVEALSAAFRGEADPAERFNLNLKASEINARMAADGLSGLEGEAANAAKAQTIMTLAMEQASGAIGQFDREGGTFAGTMQRMKAQLGDTAAEIGQSLLPYATAAVAAFKGMAEWVQANVSWLVPLGAAIGIAAGAILAINVALSAYKAIMTAVQVVQTLVTVAQNLMNKAFMANPIGLIITLVAALVAAFINLWNTNEEFRNFFIQAWNNIKTFFVTVWNAMKVAFETVMNAMRPVIDAVANWFKSSWNNAVNAVKAIVNTVRNVFSTVFNAVRSVVQGVVNWFRSAWQGAVNSVNAIINTMRAIFQNVMNAILAPIRAVQWAFDGIVSAVRNVINWIGRIRIPNFLSGLFGGGRGRSIAFEPLAVMRALSAPAYSGPSVMRMSARSAGNNRITNITVNGGMDSADAIARRIQGILNSRDRRANGITISRSTR